MLFAFSTVPALAIEGSTAAGPIGGTDIRSAQLPPPGMYGGNILFTAKAYDFVDGKGHTIPSLEAAELNLKLTGPFLLFVPDLDVLGGRIGMAGIIPIGEMCGHLFTGTASECFGGMGDPYVEVAWSRGIGHVRPSRFVGSPPIFEGVTVLAGFGAVLPFGDYDAEIARTRGLTLGNNIYDFAPAVAITVMTPALLAEGTELSAKLYWNTYRINPETRYHTGDLINLDFALTERIGRFQIGAAGFYAWQIEDDRLNGVPIPPDGRRAEVLQLGGVAAVDLPELGASAKVKYLTTVESENNVYSSGVALSWFQKF